MRKPKMTPAQRRDWLLQYLLNRQAASSSRCSVDVLDAEFVDRYVNATGAPVVHHVIGADKSSTLGPDLSALFAAGLLKRASIGVPAVTSGGGWPKWVYSYWLADPELAAAKFNVTLDHVRETIIRTNRAFAFSPA
jgi:hypothetical protein